MKEFLTENSSWLGGTDRLKKLLFKEGLLENRCGKCGLGPEWQGEPLSLQLEHHNGVRSDNRLENLRILCPNCHSQTPTYCGRKNRKPRKHCSVCNKELIKKAKGNLCRQHLYG